MVAYRERMKNAPYILHSWKPEEIKFGDPQEQGVL
jgi:hypothetical protein